MAIKLFGAGLGLFGSPFSTSGQTSRATPTKAAVPSAAALGLSVNQAGVSSLGKNQPVLTSQLPSLITTALPKLPAALAALASPKVQNTVVITSTVSPQVMSSPSVQAPYETLFHDFDFGVLPFYNFWTADELTNDKESRGTRKLEDVPRFIKLDWAEAPDLPVPTDFLKPADVRNNPIEAVKFGGQTNDGRGFTVKGVAFLPDHLQPSNFSQVLKSPANGFVSPGVLNGVIELPLSKANLDPLAQSRTDPLLHTDEDAFLTSPAAIGIPIHELRSQLSSMTNGVIGATAITGDKEVSPSAAKDRADFFDGQFSVNRPLSSTGQLQVHSVSGTPTLSFVSPLAQNSEPDQFNAIVDLASKVSPAPNISDVQESQFIRAKFVDPSVGGVIQTSKVNLMSKPEHVEAMTAMAQVLPNLEVISQSGIQRLPRRQDIPSFSSPSSVKPFEYVGYVIEKYARDTTGIFNKVEEFQIPARGYTEYIDTEVLYGEIYRYRIRAVFRWTRVSNVGPNGLLPVVITQAGSQTDAIASSVSSYFTTEWSPWRYGTLIDQQPTAPPDELTVLPDSRRKRVLVTMKVPFNLKRDLYKIRLFRKLQDGQGNDLTNWQQLTEYSSSNPLDFGPNNSLYIDTNVDFFQVNGTEYVYAAQSVNRHGDVSTLSDQLACRLNSDWASLGETPVDFVSCAGVAVTSFGAFATYPLRRIVNERILITSLTAHGQETVFVLSGREAVGNISLSQGAYTIRIESLDTGEKQDIRVNIVYNNQPPMVRQPVSSIFVVGNNMSISRSPTLIPTWVKAPVLTPLPSVGKTAPVLKMPPPGTRQNFG